MSRSSFFSSPPKERSRSPLLPQHRDSVSLRDLSPRPSNSNSSRRVSPSPPPSFYRDNISNSKSPEGRDYEQSYSPSPSRTKPRQHGRVIQFSAPPPPITGSFVLPSHHGSPHGSVNGGRGGSPHTIRRGIAIDPLIILERREKAIQADLQHLLDAQSAGLIHGFGGGSGDTDGASEAGSSTPTSRSVGRSGSQGRNNGGIIPVRQPKRKVVGLRSARRGLLREMDELVDVKKEEMEVLDQEILRREDALRKVDIWERKIETAQKRLSGASGEEPNEADAELAQLETEERVVDIEIRELSDRLATLKARKRWLSERRKEGENRKEARLSSYRGTLRETESEVKEFLRRPPVVTSAVMGDEEGFSTLPYGRRTLGMAREWWEKETRKLSGRKVEAEKERNALEEGGGHWKDCIDSIVSFEDDLRAQMKSVDPQGIEVLQRQIGKMDEVIGKLDGVIKGAEEKGWNLLVCAVGAELEAFQQGRGILQSAFEASDGKVVGNDVEKGKVERDDGDGLLNLERQETLDTEGSENDVPAGLLGLERQESMDREESEDDGPDLDQLLVDRGGRGGS